MSTEWRTIILGEICKFTAGSAFKPEYQGQDFGDYPFIKVSDMNIVGNELFINNAQNYVNESHRAAMKAKLHPAGATVFAKIGVALTTNRRRLLIRPTIVDNNMMSATPMDGEVTSRFLYLLLTSLDFNTISAGTALPYLNVSDLEKIEVSVPSDLNIQRVIERAVGALDDKIDLNRRINQTLEAMAQAIFRSWFVDFDPVKAKIAAIEQGQDPLRAAMRAISGKTDAELDQMPREHHDELAATAALFPDVMEASELGEIPKGWAAGKLAELCQLNPESWSAKSLPNVVRYVDLANAKNGEIAEVQNMDGVDIPSRARRILRQGDTIVGTVRPGNRSFALVGEANLTGSTGFAVLRPHNPHWLEFVYLVATSEFNIERLTHLADGGAYPAVRPEVVIQEDVAIPTQEVAKAFHQHVQPLFAKIQANRGQALYLAQLRDTLLPKLLSGQLRILDAEAIL